MSLFNRRQFDAEPPVPPFPGVDASGVVASPDSDRALRDGAVWACVRLLADSVAMMPLEGYRMRGKLRIPAPTPRLFVSPSSDATPSEWVYMTMVSLLLRGNLYGDIIARDREGYPLQVELLDPDRVGCRRDPATARAVYTYEGSQLNSRDVLHIRAFRFPGRTHGLSPIRYAALQLNTTAAVGKFAWDYFDKGAHPSAILSTKQNLTQDQAVKAKDRFKAAVKDREPALLSGGLEYAAIQVNPEESQFLETQKYGVNEIARIFGVPPEMIAGTAGNSMTYANVEQRSLDFLTYSVQPWLTRLESAYAALLPGSQHVRFDTSVLTRTDLSTLMTATAVGIASKQTTVDEARAMRDQPPLTDAQKAELELVPLDITATGKPRVHPTPPAPEGEPA